MVFIFKNKIDQKKGMEDHIPLFFWIHNDNTNPYFNLALEEYLLREFNHDCFMLWQNSPCVVIGRNQNALSEINADYIKEHNIPVVRRLSGGGAVFHDLGNLNYTFIVHDKRGSFPFEKFTAPLIDVLQKLSIKAERSRRNDLTIDGKKISGSAQYRHKNRVLHHGTLLFSSDLAALSSALAANYQRAGAEFAGRGIRRGIRSVVSQVTNISDHTNGPLTIAEFHDLIIDHIKGMYKNFFAYTLTHNDLDRINRLAGEKYSTWEWNFGRSPHFRSQN